MSDFSDVIYTTSENELKIMWLQVFQLIFCMWAMNCLCKEVFSTIAQAIYCPPKVFGRAV